MSVIGKENFHKEYGPGHQSPVLSTAVKTPQHDLDVLTALAVYFKPRRVLEIGVNTGLTAAAILEACPDIEQYIGVDLERSAVWYCAPGETVGCYAAKDPRFTLLLRPRGAFDLAPDELGQIDFVFVDGNHTRACVQHDSQLARALVAREGGVIVWHDYKSPGNPDVPTVIHELNAIEDRIAWVQGTWCCFEIRGREGGARKAEGGAGEPNGGRRAVAADQKEPITR